MKDAAKKAEGDAAAEELRKVVAAKAAKGLCQDTRRRAAAILGASLAASLAPPATEIKQPKPEPAAPGKAALAALLVCFALSGCVAPEAIEQARVEGAACHGLAVLPLNNREVRQVAARQAVAWQRQHEALTGEPIPGSESWLKIPADVLAPEAPR